MRKREKAVFVFVSSILVIGLVGISVMGYFTGGVVPTPSSSDSHVPSGSSGLSASSGVENDYDSLKSNVVNLEQQIKANPADSSLQLNLANAYYDLGVSAQQNSPDESTDDFNKAVENYQSYLKNNKDINVLVDMATASFYAGNNDLAEHSFKEALAEQPDFFNAVYNYGIFLSNAKNDYKGAVALWQEALNKDPNGPNAAKLQSLISQYQSATGKTSTSGKSGSATEPLNDGSSNPH